MTKQQLDTKVKMLHSACKRLGIIREGEETCLQEGSKINGRAFRLYLSKDGRGSHHTHPCCIGNAGYLGMTKREASEALAFILDGLFAAEDALSAR